MIKPKPVLRPEPELQTVQPPGRESSPGRCIVSSPFDELSGQGASWEESQNEGSEIKDITELEHLLCLYQTLSSITGTASQSARTAVVLVCLR